MTFQVLCTSLQVRSGGLRALAAALQCAQGQSAAALRAEENAPLVGHMASVLLQVSSVEAPPDVGIGLLQYSIKHVVPGSRWWRCRRQPSGMFGAALLEYDRLPGSSLTQNAR